MGCSQPKITGCIEHKHSCWEIVIINEGGGTVCTENGNFDFSEGCAYVLPPNVKHCSYSDSSFSDVYIHTDSLNFNPEKMTCVSGIEDLPQLAKSIHNLYLKRHQGYSRSLDDMLRFIVQLIFDSTKENYYSSLAVEIRNYISQKIADSDLSMESISKEFGYNPDYIRRLFKKDFGTTPSAFLTRLRMSLARKLLREMSFYSVEQVARLCGYQDPLYFSRAFKKENGVSPKKYRAEN